MYQPICDKPGFNTQFHKKQIFGLRIVNNLHCLSVQPLFTPLKVVSSHEQPAPKHSN